MSTRCKSASVKASTSFNCASLNVISRKKILTLVDTFFVSSCLISPLLCAVAPTSLFSPSHLLKSEILDGETPDAFAYLTDLTLFALAMAAMISKASMGRCIMTPFVW
jgi:hypothetical protein